MQDQPIRIGSAAMGSHCSRVWDSGRIQHTFVKEQRCVSVDHRSGGKAKVKAGGWSDGQVLGTIQAPGAWEGAT